jgi:hypothetical protein
MQAAASVIVAMLAGWCFSLCCLHPYPAYKLLLMLSWLLCRAVCGVHKLHLHF